MGRLTVFAQFLYYIVLLFLFTPKFCLNEFSVTTGQIYLKFGDMVGMDVKLCKRVSKDSKAGLRACPKLYKFCPDYFSQTTQEIVLKFFYMINIDVYM